jgi:lipid A 3-O-deacylase
MKKFIILISAIFSLSNGNAFSAEGDRSLLEKKLNNSNSSYNNISLYTGTFDLIDKEGDDQTNLFGIEHKNPDLFRDTFLGKFKPVSGAFMTGKSSVYLYTGVEAQYGIGPLKILPSFAPGYYEKGDGKDLGSVLEFKSELKFGLDIFEKSNLSYSYSHISNNDWGKTNPGTDNQQITFSKSF